MRREILYKGKRKDNGKWVEGSLITGVFRRCGKDIPYILDPDKADYDCFEDFSEENGIFEVDHETICQFTGFYDATQWDELSAEEQKAFLFEWKFGENRKNAKEDWKGRKIFERDICEFSVFDFNGDDTQYKGVVVYTGSRFMLWKSNESEYYGDDGGFDLDWVVSQDDEFEVIGNIFDNPELLK